MRAKIALLPGDGIGPEIMPEARRMLEAVAARFGHSFEFGEYDVGGVAIDRAGDPLPPPTLEASRAADAVLLGAVGGPKWSDPSAPVRPEQGLLRIRKELGLYANLRPVRPHPALLASSPLRPELLSGVDMLVVRELTGGLYFGEKRRERGPDGERAIDVLEYAEGEIRRIVTLGFELARARRRRLTSIDKANVLESSRLWRSIAAELGRSYPDVVLDHQLVDSAAMRIVTAPASFDVVVTENMFGDILSDEASVLVGSLGVLPSASLGRGSLGLYEPMHGSAPDIAGKGVANPVGMILSAAMLLRHSLRLEREAFAVEASVAAAFASGARTADLAPPGGRALSTRAMGDAVLDAFGAG